MIDRLRQQAQELEGVFLNTLMKEMFASLHADEGAMGGGFGEATWRDMQAEQLANTVAEAGGIGLADALLPDLLAAQEAAQTARTQLNGTLQMNAAERIAAIDTLPAADLCGLALSTLDRLVEVLNQETTLLRAGRARDASELTPEKTRLAQDYMGFARSVQRQLERLRVEAPASVEALRLGHEKLATQMAENLRVIATARAVTEDLLNDVATAISAKARPRTYGATGQVTAPAAAPASGVSINRAL